MKTIVRTYGGKFYTNFPGLNVLEDDMECESLQSFLFIFCLLLKTDITCKYI